MQRRRKQCAAERFFRRLLKGQGGEPRWLVTDKLRSYDAAHRTVMPTVSHINHVYANNRAHAGGQLSALTYSGVPSLAGSGMRVRGNAIARRVRPILVAAR